MVERLVYKCKLDVGRLPMPWVGVTANSPETAASNFLRAYFNTPQGRRLKSTNYVVHVLVPGGPISCYSLDRVNDKIGKIEHRNFVLATEETFDPDDFFPRLARLLELFRDEGNDAAVDLAYDMLSSLDPAWIELRIPNS
jgi:hypothetical protein